MRGEFLNALQEWLFSSVGAPSVKPEWSTTPDGLSKATLVRNGYKISHSASAVARVRRHQFYDIGSFADWLNRHAAALQHQTEILGDGNLDCIMQSKSTAGQISATLGAMENANQELVTCTLAPHPRFLRWFSAIGKYLTQKELQFLLTAGKGDIPGKVTDANGNFLSSMGDFILNQVSSIQMTKGANFDSQLSPNGSWLVRAANETTSFDQQLPSSFIVEVPMIRGIVGMELTDGEPKFVELSYQFEVLLRIDTDDALSFQLHAPGLEVVYEQAFSDALKFLENRLEDGFMVGRGKLETAVVNVPFSE